MSTVPLFGAAEWAQKQMHDQCWTGIIKPRAAITQPPSGHVALSPKIQLKENANWDHPREDWTSKHIKTTHPGCQRQQVGYETIPQKRWLLTSSHIQHSPIYVVQHSPILQTQQIWSTQKGHVQASGWIPNAPALLRCPRSVQRNWTRCRTWLARRSSQSAVSKAGAKLSQDAKTLREKDYDLCQGLSSINELQSVWKQPYLLANKIHSWA